MNDLEQSQRDSHDFFATAVLFEMGLGVVALLLGWLFEHSPLASIQSRLSFEAAAAAVFWGVVATVPMLVGLWVIEHVDVPALRELSDYVSSRLVPLLADCSWWQLAIISLLAGGGEEMLFRGWLQSILQDWIGGPAAVPLSLLAASVLFGVCHAMTTTYFLVATVIGIYLGWLYLITGNLLAPIIAHALYDFCALLYLTRDSAKASEQQQSA